MNDLLAYLIAPHTSESFYENYYENKPFIVHRGDATYYDQIITTQDVLAFLKQKGAVYPFVFAIKNRSIVDENGYTELVKHGLDHSFEFINSTKLVEEFLHRNASIVMHETQRTILKMSQFCELLSKELGHALRANIYMTPSHSKGLGTHFDNHDAFILQIAGSKHWKVYNEAYELPYKGEKNHSFLKEASSRDCIINETLKQGDIMFLPRGYVHEVQALEQNSTHITVSIQITRNKQLLENILEESKADVFLRRAVPTGIHQTKQVTAYKQMLKDYLCQLIDEKTDLKLAEMRRIVGNQQNHETLEEFDQFLNNKQLVE